MRRRPWMPLAASFLVYTILAAWMGRDVLRQVGTGVVNDAGDPLLTAAILYWNATQVPLSDAWWQFPAFVPTGDALAFSEHLLGISVIATPLYWITRDPIVTYNLVTLLTFPLCGIAMFALVRRLTGSIAGAFVAGLAFGFAPYRVSQLPHVQMLAAFWAPVALLGLHAYVETGKRRWLALYAGTWMLQAAANGYCLIFFSVLVGLWVLWFVVARGKWAALGMIAAATAIASIPLAPILYVYLTVHARHGFVRSLDEMREFSADVAAVLCAPTNLTVWSWLRQHCGPEGELFPGIAVVALAVAGLVRMLASPDAGARMPRAMVWARRILLTVGGVYAGVVMSILLFGAWRVDLGTIRVSASSVIKPFVISLFALLGVLFLSPGVRAAARRSSTVGFYLVAAVITWMLALGPTITFMGRRLSAAGPFAWLALLPGANGLRVPARFWLMTVLCLAAAAGIVVADGLRGRPVRVKVAALLLVSALILSDGWTRMLVAPAPSVADARGLAGQIVLELPSGDVRDIAAQFRAVIGGWKTVNGYSGYIPSYYPALRDAIRNEEEAAFLPFQADRDLHVIVQRDAPRLQALVERQPGVLVTAAGAASVQYRLPRRPAGHPPRDDGKRLTVVTARSACSTTLLAYVVDGDEGTRWRCELEDERQTLMVDLGRVVMTGKVVHRLGPFYWEFPRRLVIDTSEDGATWQNAWDASVLGEVIHGGLADPRSLSVVLPFAPRLARYVRLRHVGREAAVGWTLAELEVWSN